MFSYNQEIKSSLYIKLSCIIFNLPIPFLFICENSRQSSGDNAVMHTKTNLLERVGLGRLNLFNFVFDKDKDNQRK